MIHEPRVLTLNPRWHAHSEFMRADGLYGALIVHPPTNEDVAKVQDIVPDYDEDLVLLVGDWYHLPAQEVQASYDTYTHWGMEPAPDSLIINGLGVFNCSKLHRSKATNCSAVPTPELTPRGSRSRLRIVNVGYV